MLNRIAFDSAVGKGGVLARLKLVGELARVKAGLKDADNALARLKLAARANQIRVELGAGQTARGGALPLRLKLPRRRMPPPAMTPRPRRVTRRPSITSSTRTASRPSARRTTPLRWLCSVASTLAKWMRRA